MANKYLDYNGTLYFWGKLKAYFVPKTTTVNGHALSGNVTVTASDVSAIPTSAKGAASGVCPLNSSGKVDASYLPVYNGGVQ